MSTIISVKFHAGLGNNMFQAAFAYAFSKKIKAEYELTHFDHSCQSNKISGRNSDGYKDFVFHNFDLSPKHNDYTMHHSDASCVVYQNIPYKRDCKNTYDGYYQSYRFFYGYDNEIRDIYLRNNKIFQIITEK